MALDPDFQPTHKTDTSDMGRITSGDLRVCESISSTAYDGMWGHDANAIMVSVQIGGVTHALQMKLEEGHELTDIERFLETMKGTVATTFLLRGYSIGITPYKINPYVPIAIPQET